MGPYMMQNYSVINNSTGQHKESQRASNKMRLQAYHYRLWWLEGVFTIITASVLLVSGLAFLIGDALSGHGWWKPAFWCEPLPPKPEDPTGSGGESGEKAKADESTPLKPPA